MAAEKYAVSFLGLGRMGSAMARHVISSGYKTTVWNRSPLRDELKQRLTSAGEVSFADSCSGCIQSSEVVLLMLWDYQSILDVLENLGDADYANRTFISYGSFIVCLNSSHVTISPDESKQLRDLINSKAAQYIEAPVLGNNSVADRGQLQILVGANEEQFTMYTPLLSSFGTPRYLGDVGTATSTKLALNFLFGANLTAFASSYSYLDSVGANLDTFMTILTNGPFYLSGGYQPIWAKRFASADFDSNVAFTVQGLDKDLSLARNEFASAGINTSVIDGVFAPVHELAQQEEGAQLEAAAVVQGIKSRK